METQYTRHLAAEDVCYQPEKVIKFKNVVIGRADQETTDLVVERKVLSKWKHALGQVLAYAFTTGKQPVLELIDDLTTDSQDLQEVVNQIAAHYQVTVRHLEPVSQPTFLTVISKMKKGWLINELLAPHQPERQKLCQKITKSRLLVEISGLHRETKLHQLSLSQLQSLAKAWSLPGAHQLTKEALATSLELICCPNRKEAAKERSQEKLEHKPTKRKVSTSKLSLADSYKDHKLTELKEMAKQRGLTGYSQLRKDALIEYLITGQRPKTN